VGIASSLQPVAHTFTQVHEELCELVSRLSAHSWQPPSFGGWSVGQHVIHLQGSTDRLLTYADGRALSDAQREALAAERAAQPEAGREPDLQSLLDRMRDGVFAQLRSWSEKPPTDLLSPRAVGRDQLPSTVLGLLFHAAEHAQRHAGQAAIIARSLHVAPGRS
jgi:uncharacterized damage-inducible protein DinB